MIIRNKLESIEKINKLGLNKFPEELFKDKEKDKVKEFLESNPAKYYAIRDRSKASGVFKLAVDYDKVMQEIEDYNLFTINVSSYNYVDNQLLAGEIQFLSNNEVYATLSTNIGASARDATLHPTFNIKTDIFDDRVCQEKCVSS